jgi:peptidoglycan-N-acetylglucosamine deacetylase
MELTKHVTLTFDNGPDPDVTPRVLEILAGRDILTTFFVLGRNMADPECRRLAQAAHAAGHWIGNHTYAHAGPIGLDPDPGAAQREIGETQALIGDLSHPDKMFRPCGGGGKLNAELFAARDRNFLIAGGYSCVLWNAVPGDWNNPDGWVERAFEMIDQVDWPLVVIHDVPGACIGRLEAFLDGLAGREIEIRQEIPPACMPIRRGEIVEPEFFATLVAA